MGTSIPSDFQTCLGSPAPHPPKGRWLRCPIGTQLSMFPMKHLITRGPHHWLSTSCSSSWWLTTQLVPFLSHYSRVSPWFLSLSPTSYNILSILLPYSLHPTSSSSPPVPPQTILPSANVYSFIKSQLRQSPPLGNLLRSFHSVTSQAGFPFCHQMEEPALTGELASQSAFKGKNP